MASLLSDIDIFTRTGALNDLFDTTCRDITINKAPVVSILNTNTEVLPGYGPMQTSENQVTFTPEAGVFPAVVIDNHKQNPAKTAVLDNKLVFTDCDLVIKIRKDAMRFIRDGQTENIVVDDLIYIINSGPITQNYLGLVFYYYGLKGTT